MAGFVINSVHLSGNLTKDPETREAGGQTVCKLRLAVNDRVKSGDEWTDRPNYFDVNIWRGVGEWAGSNLHKGDQVVVSGKLHWHEWETDGNKRSAVDVTADTVILMRSRDGGTSSRSFEQDVPIDTADLPDVSNPPTGLPDTDDIPF